jgi:thiamine-monophosphate kinase
MRIANSLIDVSDGVAADLGQICAESGFGAVVEHNSIPTTAAFLAYCKQFNQDSRHLSLHVGEDYVLLGTVPPEAADKLDEALKSEGCDYYPIGVMVLGSGLKLKHSDGTTESIGAYGWDHFK